MVDTYATKYSYAVLPELASALMEELDASSLETD